MSALARYYHSKGFRVMGYDLTETPLTQKMEAAGIEINYTDTINFIPDSVKSDLKTRIIFTPAIPQNNKQLNFFISSGYTLKKRAEILGEISKDYRTIAIAGTHGKTTTSAMVAHIMNSSVLGCMAFVGGIMSGYESNVILNPDAEWVVVEADEFDRSFLKLMPDLLGITSIDADHLDVYSDATDLESAFEQLIENSNPANPVIINDAVNQAITSGCITYGIKPGSDIVLSNESYINGYHRISVSGLTDISEVFELAMPGLHNAQNAVLAASLCKNAGCTIDEIKQGLRSFKGVKRRFEYIIKSPETIFIDDYAHHPREIDALISSVRNMYPKKKLPDCFSLICIAEHVILQMNLPKVFQIWMNCICSKSTRHANFRYPELTLILFFKKCN